MGGGIQVCGRRGEGEIETERDALRRRYLNTLAEEKKPVEKKKLKTDWREDY